MRVRLGVLGRVEGVEKDFILVVFIFFLVALSLLIINIFWMPKPVQLPLIYTGAVQQLDEYQLMTCNYASNTQNCDKLDSTGIVSMRDCCRLKEVCCR